MRRTRIIENLNEQFNQFSNWYEQREPEILEQGPEGAWTAGQHLLHIIKSTKPLGQALGYPKILLRLRFGGNKKGSRDYDAVVADYKWRLDEGGLATGDYVPRKVKAEEKDALLKRLRDEKQNLVDNLDSWAKGKLDKYLLPHPLLGKITVREMLCFTIYHTEHHRKILEERY